MIDYFNTLVKNYFHNVTEIVIIMRAPNNSIEFRQVNPTKLGSVRSDTGYMGVGGNAEAILLASRSLWKDSHVLLSLYITFSGIQLGRMRNDGLAAITDPLTLSSRSLKSSLNIYRDIQ